MCWSLEPEGQALKVDRVRQMQRDSGLPALRRQTPVCILTAADRMAPNMSNTLLKTLEEPPLHTVIILLANSSKAILPTILSRCQQIPFNPLPLSSLTQWLIEQKGLREEEAHLLAALSEGSPGRALKLQEEIHQIQREDLLQGWLGMKTFFPLERSRAGLNPCPPIGKIWSLSLKWPRPCSGIW